MTTTTNTNDVMGVIKPTTNVHNNIDDLSFFDFKVEKRPLFFESTEKDTSVHIYPDEKHANIMTEIKGKHAVVRADQSMFRSAWQNL